MRPSNCPRCRSAGTVIAGLCSVCDGEPSDVAQEAAALLSTAAFLSKPGVGSGRVNQYGAKGIIKYDPTTAETNSGIRNMITLVDWASKSGRPEPVTVELGIIASSGGASFPKSRVTDHGVRLSYRTNAQIILGSPAAMLDPIFVDLDQRFVCAASYCAVTAQMLAPPTGYVSGSIAVVGSLSEGEAISVAPVVSTQFIDNLGSTLSSAAIVIPSKAAQILPIYGSDQTGSFKVEIHDCSDAIIEAFAYNVGAMIAPYPIPDDAYSVVLTNTGNVIANFRLLFQMSL